MGVHLCVCVCAQSCPTLCTGAVAYGYVCAQSCPTVCFGAVAYGCVCVCVCMRVHARHMGVCVCVYACACSVISDSVPEKLCMGVCVYVCDETE